MQLVAGVVVMVVGTGLVLAGVIRLISHSRSDSIDVALVLGGLVVALGGILLLP